MSPAPARCRCVLSPALLYGPRCQRFAPAGTGRCHGRTLPAHREDGVLSLPCCPREAGPTFRSASADTSSNAGHLPPRTARTKARETLPSKLSRPFWKFMNHAVSVAGAIPCIPGSRAPRSVSRPVAHGGWNVIVPEALSAPVLEEERLVDDACKARLEEPLRGDVASRAQLGIHRPHHSSRARRWRGPPAQASAASIKPRVPCSSPSRREGLPRPSPYAVARRAPPASLTPRRSP